MSYIIYIVNFAILCALTTSSTRNILWAAKIQIQTQNWVWLPVYVYGNSQFQWTHTFHIWKVLRLNLYFDGTQAYGVVARSFAAFSSSYAPDSTIILIAGMSAHPPPLPKFEPKVRPTTHEPFFTTIWYCTRRSLSRSPILHPQPGRYLRVIM